MAFESVKKVAEAEFPTRWGAFRILGFEGTLPAPSGSRDGVGSPAQAGKVEGLVALVMGDIHYNAAVGSDSLAVSDGGCIWFVALRLPAAT